MLVAKVIYIEKNSLLRNKTQSFSFHFSEIEIYSKKKTLEKTIPENFSSSLNQENIF